MNKAIKTGVSYFGNRNPRHFISDLEEILTHNCNFIVHTFSENDQQFYKETMREMVSMSKDAGLECYVDPWGHSRWCPELEPDDGICWHGEYVLATLWCKDGVSFCNFCRLFLS